MYAMAEADFRSLLQRTSSRRLGQWRRYARSLTRNESDAEDVVQEAIANTLRRAPDLDTETRVHYYVRQAIHNTAMSLLAQRQRLAPAEDAEAIAGAESSALEIMLANENELAQRRLGRVLRGKLPDLRDEHREVIEALVMTTPRLKLREVAEMQGVTTATVHYRLKVALRALLELAEAELPELRAKGPNP